MEIQHQLTTIGGNKIHYLTAGDKGSPVLLIHGAGIDSAELSWGDVILPLAQQGYRVFAPDLPGYGDSDWPDISYNLDFNIHFLSQFMQCNNLQKTSLVGLSMGGATALGFTLSLPDQVDRLVLVDSYGIQRKVDFHFLSWLSVITPGLMESAWAITRSSKSMTRWFMSGVFADTARISESLLEMIFTEARKPHAGRTFTRQQRDEMRANGVKTVYLDRLPEIQSPTLIIHGKKDVGVPLACAEEAHRLIPNSDLKVIEETGHWPQREQPEKFLKVLLDFFPETQYKENNHQVPPQVV